MSDCCSAPGLLPFEDALENLLSQITPVTETLTLPISQALNYVLAQEIASPLNVPNHDNSAMDGYAFAIESFQTSKVLTLIGRSMAGSPFEGECKLGECIRIMTGAKMPESCDSVEMQENVQVDDNNITFLNEKSFGSHVRKAGEDIKLGQPVFSPGHKLSAIDIGILSSLGISEVQVYRRVKVALISTGDELKLPGQILASGDIYESNSFVLRGMLEKLHIEVIDFGIIEDDFDLIKAAFVSADKQADAVISSGGVSVGEADYTKTVLDDLGEIGFWKIAMKPGKPFAFGKLPNSIFFGLPGNPVSALVTFHQLAMLGLTKMQNAEPLKRTYLKVKCVKDLKKSPGRMDFQRGVLSVNDQGDNVVESTGSQGSGILSSLVQANCFIVLPAEQGKVKAGEVVTVQLFDQFIT
ncbi:molybdopterin molybdotransferase MoeA [Colwellia sp. 4_MG-2023]|uniref:molybdopterin molybdotransferase MoeA n=1 Tax=unclassified Colwellia TaxID=196834 RepID=UPI001C0959F0|nr:MULTISPECIES: molybdopterin molybdotransferase MoeA [unclassified Colwellia]MBU2924172.1 molybdopterin molybdotransferase MoeA [Colwellia sp. C2M11]MDO6486877.1 molybdopterin molybdotransferase MoeA [Colwellia sp. 6_MG-2023]MDO6506205.1 molybdopterin molybdotransferase MoeA [Colwellia sp. 5_MG-2023]MDO6554735.1 molybdopterin molybdotransferase MoeA [Colwellia sp. 4_MG-2023]MDO6652062.1 molybdopterin molybdotransferase MoeA [Colwellia sp. 3_MG-2023]